MTIPKITPCLWYDSQAEEAAKFYTSIFKNGKIGKITRFGKEGFEIHGRPKGNPNSEKSQRAMKAMLQ